MPVRTLPVIPVMNSRPDIACSKEDISVPIFLRFSGCGTPFPSGNCPGHSPGGTATLLMHLSYQALQMQTCCINPMVQGVIIYTAVYFQQSAQRWHRQSFVSLVINVQLFDVFRPSLRPPALEFLFPFPDDDPAFPVHEYVSVQGSVLCKKEVHHVILSNTGVSTSAVNRDQCPEHGLHPPESANS